MEDNQLNARTGPPAGPIQAKMAENACMGPHIGPVRALKSRASAPGITKKETASFETVSFCAVGERITHIRKALIINYLWHKKMKLGVK